MAENISVSIQFDTEKIAGEIQTKSNKATKVLCSEVLKDSNFYIPRETGTMEKSAILSTELSSGKVSWNTPYVKKQYHNWKGGRFSHNNNPNATAEWFETAKAVKLQSWEKIVNDQLNKNN